MEKQNIKKEYTNGEVTIIWQSGLCIHSGNCVKNLSAVFKPKDHPWIQPENASTQEIIETVKKCPSGALSIKE
ncbi:MAG: (4Fe-4S)-binding protein [Saprospiraceae bacterium]